MLFENSFNLVTSYRLKNATVQYLVAEHSSVPDRVVSATREDRAGKS